MPAKLTSKDFSPAYFGDIEESRGLRHDAGYTNYLELETNYIAERNIKKFFTRHNIPKTVRVLELGSAVGFMGKIAKQEGHTDWVCVDWSNWCKRHEVYPVIEQDALTFLTSQDDNSFDYIISKAFLECFNDDALKILKIEMDRVGKNQIHYLYKEPNPLYYNTSVKLIISEARDIG